MNMRTFLIVVVACIAFAPCTQAADAPNKEGGVATKPSHAEAAIIFAKYSGLFDRYVPEDAGLDDCVSFLNKTGIYFGLLEIVNGSEFALQDCARVMGQMNLVFSGEAEFVGGKVRLPKGIDSWKDFCILNDVKYKEGYYNLCATARILHELSK